MALPEQSGKKSQEKRYGWIQVPLRKKPPLNRTTTWEIPKSYDSRGKKRKKKISFLKLGTGLLVLQCHFSSRWLWHTAIEIMLEVQGANILVEILNKFEIWEWNLDLAVNIFLPIGQESAGCWHLLLCHRHNTAASTPGATRLSCLQPAGDVYMGLTSRHCRPTTLLKNSSQKTGPLMK